MASDQFSASDVMIHQQLHPFGHEIRYTFTLFNPAAMQDEWEMIQETQTFCDTAPTGWRFIMRLARVENLRIVSGYCKLKRTDTLPFSVRIFLAVRVDHQDFQCHVPIPEIDDIVYRREEMFINVWNIVPQGYNHLLHEELSVLVHMYVRDCHDRIPNFYGQPDVETEKKKKRWFLAKL